MGGVIWGQAKTKEFKHPVCWAIINSFTISRSLCPCMGISDLCGRLLDKLIGLHGKAGFKLTV